MTKVNFLFVLIFIFAILIFLMHYWIVGSIVWGDGQYYYAYLRSIVIDKDLNFQNELEHFTRIITYTSAGWIGNKYSIGPAILWLPFFLLAHLCTNILRVFGLNILPDGYSVLYQVFTGVGSLLYAVFGLRLCYETSSLLYSKKTSFFATLLIWMASNLFFYTSVDPINSHPLSFFISSLIIYLITKWNRYKLRQIIILGLLVGLLSVIRNQDIVFALPLILVIGINPGLLLFIFTLFLAFVPQLAVWQYLYGQLSNPYLVEGEKFYWTNPRIVQVLFSQNNGLYYYSPILILSTAGLLWFTQKKRFLAISGIIIFTLETYLIASWHDWHGGAAYGGRMFISCTPYFILSLAALIEKAALGNKTLFFTSFLFIVVNFISIIIFLIISP